MAWTFTAKLLDSNIDPLSSTAVRIGVQTGRGIEVLVTGETDRSGKLALEWATDATDPVSDLVLQYQKGRRWLTLTAPRRVSGISVDLGSLMVTELPIRTDATDVFGIDIKKTGETIQDLQSQKTDYEESIQRLQDQINENSEILSNKITEIDQLKSKNTDLEESLAERSNELADLRQSKNELEQTILDKNKQIDQLSVELHEARQGDASGEKIVMSDMLQKTGEQLKRAQETLSGADGAFRLGKISMQIKGIASDDGTKIQFLRTEDLLKLPPNSLSSVLTEFVPPSTAITVEETPEAIVPNVEGYTELMARRKLEQAGYFVDASHQVTSEARRSNRVLVQVPAAGAEAPSGSIVKIMIGLLERSE